MKVCSIEGCQRRVHGNGLCRPHNRRRRCYGDPLGQGKTENGSVQKYFTDVVLKYDGDDCLTWPYARQWNGRGKIGLKGKTKEVHRAVCEEVYGLPPTPKHEAAHSCGNGHLGCVAKRHLSWKTHKENEADKVGHGTRNWGERVPTAKLTERNVIDIWSMKNTATQRVIAERFGVAKATINAIYRRKNWSATPTMGILGPSQK